MYPLIIYPLAPSVSKLSDAAKKREINAVVVAIFTGFTRLILAHGSRDHKLVQKSQAAQHKQGALRTLEETEINKTGI